MAGAREVSYGVYFMQGGRWIIQTSYPAHAKDAAIQEAKALERMPNLGGAKVVRESYDAGEGLTTDVTIYKTDGLGNEPGERLDRNMERGRPAAPARPTAAARPARAPAPPPAGAARPSPAAHTAPPVRAAAPRRKTSAPAPAKAAQSAETATAVSVLNVFTKLALITMSSVAAAALMTGLASMGLSNLHNVGIVLSAAVQNNVLFGIFLASFLLAAVPLAIIFMSRTSMATRSRRSAAKAAPAPKAAAEPAESRRDAPAPVGDTAVPPPAAAPPEPPPKPEPEAKPEATAAETKEPPPRGVTLDAETYGTDDKKTKEEKEKQEKEDRLPPHAEKQKVFMMKFLGEGLQKLGTSQKKMDGHNKFGVNLFLAGACEAMRQEREIGAKTSAAILAEVVKVMGFEKAQAKSFAEGYEKYLLTDSRYVQMFQAGRTAMDAFLAEDAEAGKHLEQALAEWNKPKSQEETPAPVTVMFTDMVGSTKLTQTKGDAVAQQVVRTHNRIVREALTAFSGREIKHTGDGIMASFSSTAGSVAAAIDIQRQTAKHTKSNPELPLHLKIGINAGQPIAEDDDLFGTTVQLSARIVDKAGAGQIFVSDTVRGLCAGKDLQFVSRGEFEMKGIDEPITLYEVPWDTEAAAAPEAAATPEAAAPAPAAEQPQAAAQPEATAQPEAPKTPETPPPPQPETPSAPETPPALQPAAAGTETAPAPPAPEQATVAEAAGQPPAPAAEPPKPEGGSDTTQPAKTSSGAGGD